MEVGYEANFQSDVPVSMRCTCCKYVLRKPLMAVTCGHRYCSQCVEKLKRYSEVLGRPMVCPADLREILPFEINEDKATENLIGSLSVSCDYDDRGCPWSGTLDSLETHAAQCEFRDAEELSITEMVCRMSKKLDTLESTIKEKNAEIDTLKKEVAELLEAKKEIVHLKEENEKFKDKLMLLDDLVKNIYVHPNDVVKTPSNVLQEEDMAKAKEGMENFTEKKFSEVNDKLVLLKANMAVLNAKVAENVNELGKLKEIEKEVINGASSGEKISEVLFCKFSTKKTVFKERFCNLEHHEIGDILYGHKFYSRPNGLMFQLVIKRSDKNSLDLGIKACRGKVEETVTTQLFNTSIVLSVSSNEGREFVGNYTRADYGSTFEFPRRENGSETNIHWEPGIFLFEEFVINDTFSVTCTM